MTYGGAYGTVLAEQSAAQRPHVRDDLVVAAVTVLSMVLLAAPVGLLWAHVSPRALLLAQEGGVGLAEVETKAFIAGDGSFLFISLLVGALCGVIAYFLAGHHGAVLAIALAGGGVLAALIAWKVGHRVDLSAMRTFFEAARPGQTAEAAVDLRAKGAIVGWPLASLVAYFGLVLLGDRDPARSRLS